VVLFLSALVVCAVGAVNAWPFSSWRLFSSLRTDRQSSWQAMAVDTSGRERDFPIAAMPHGYRGFRPIMNGFASRSSGSRNAVCGIWLRGATRRFGPSTEQLRIYHLHWLLSDRHGGRAGPPKRTLAWTCGPKGADVAT
jgi:hypothetical protein